VVRDRLGVGSRETSDDAREQMPGQRLPARLGQSQRGQTAWTAQDRPRSYAT
jgi:hypothetical protein